MTDFILQNVPSSVSALTPGYIFGGYGPNFVWSAGTNTTLPNTNKANVMLFYVPFTIAVTKVTVFVNGVSASSSQAASFGLYNTSLNKIVDSGTFNISTGQSTGVKSNTITSSLVTPGFYYYVWTTNSTDATFASGVAATNPENMMNQNASRTGTGGNTTNGVLNGTITIATTSGATPALCIFEP